MITTATNTQTSARSAHIATSFHALTPHIDGPTEPEHPDLAAVPPHTGGDDGMRGLRARGPSGRTGDRARTPEGGVRRLCHGRVRRARRLPVRSAHDHHRMPEGRLNL